MKPQVTEFQVPVRAAAPQAIAIALGLGWLYGKNNRPNQDGATRIGYPAIGLRSKYQGYVFPPQLFTGYSASRVAAGSVKVTPAGLPSTSTPLGELSSPLARAMATVGAAQLGGG